MFRPPFALILLVLLVGACSLVGVPARSSSSTTGDIGGTIKTLDRATRRLAPVANAFVRITGGPALLNARTDKTGKYVLRDLPPGTYALVAAKQGYATIARANVTVNAAAGARLDFRLEWADSTSGAVEVTVTTTRRVGLGGSTVTLFRGAAIQAQANTDGLGTVIFSGLPPDFYNVRASRPGYFDSSTRDFKVIAGRMTPVTLPMQRDSNQVGSIGGIVTALDGTPVRSATVSFAAGLTTGQTKTDGAGRYQFPEVIPGPGYALQASAGGFATQVQTGITVRQALQTIVNFALVPTSPTTGSIAGLISDNTHAPLPFATVTVTSGPDTGRRVQADAEGRYVINELTPAGNYAILAEQPGFTPAGQTGIKVGAAETTLVDLSLQRRVTAPGRVAGTVREQGSGLLLPGVLVELTTGASAGLSTLTDGAGHYQMDGVIPDDGYTVRFSKDRYDVLSQPGVQVTSAGITTLDVNLLPLTIAGGRIVGTVKRSGGGPLAGVTVTLFKGVTSPLTATTGKDGAFAFRNLRPGSNYALRASKGGFVTQEKTGLTVTAGSDTTVNIALKKGSNLGAIQGQVVNLLLQPVVNARVRMIEGPVLPAETTTDRQGTFTFDALPQGIYGVEVSANGLRTTQRHNIIVTPGRTTSVVIPMLPP